MSEEVDLWLFHATDKAEVASFSRGKRISWMSFLTCITSFEGKPLLTYRRVIVRQTRYITAFQGVDRTPDAQQ
jgi:hypothetical protein